MSAAHRQVKLENTRQEITEILEVQTKKKDIDGAHCTCEILQFRHQSTEHSSKPNSCTYSLGEISQASRHVRKKLHKITDPFIRRISEAERQSETQIKSHQTAPEDELTTLARSPKGDWIIAPTNLSLFRSPKALSPPIPRLSSP
jgi:hypothetical protein